MKPHQKFREFIRTDNGVLLAIASLKFLIHLYTNLFGGYGIFRDELYYLACAEHPAAGYVDQPPLSIWALAALRSIIGDSVFAIRLLPAFVGTVTVYLTGVLACKMGGGRFAIVLTAIVSVFSLIRLGMDSLYSMNTFDHLLWAAAFLVLVRIIRSDEDDSRSLTRNWILLGIVFGLGLLNKIGVLWFGTGLFAGILLTKREWLKTPGPWIAGTIAALTFIPYVIWNLQNDLAHLEFIRNATSGKYSGLNALSFLRDQLLINNPAASIVWISGLLFLFFSDNGKRYRLLGIVYATACTVLLLNQHSKAEYLAPAYPPLFAAGAIAIEKITMHQSWHWLRPLIVVPLILTGVIISPLVITVLPVETYISYAETLGIEPSTSESKQLDKLPQYYADMFGWEDKARAVAEVYH